MKAIYKREVSSYFNSMTGWVFVAVLTFFIGIYFFVNNLFSGYPYFSVSLNSVLVVFMVMPARERSLNYEHNQEMRAYADKLNLANQKADSLQKEADQYRQEKEAAEENLSSLMGDSDSTLSQYGPWYRS